MATFVETSVSGSRSFGCFLSGVTGVEQLVNGVWVGNTNVTNYNSGRPARLRVFSTYTGLPYAAYVTLTSTQPTTLTFSNPEQWSISNNGLFPFATLRQIQTVTTATPVAGSSDCIFSNEDKELEKFTIVPGELSTEECANGGYDEICVKTIFTQLKNYIYNEDIFGQIRDKFAAFYSSIALEQRIVDSIIKLVQKLLAGEITIDQFNELVKIDEQIFAGQFAKDYVTNYVKLQENIIKYKYLLTE